MDFISALHIVLDSNRKLGLQPEKWRDKGLVLIPTQDNYFLEFFRSYDHRPVSIEINLYFESWDVVTLFNFSDDDTPPGGPE